MVIRRVRLVLLLGLALATVFGGVLPTVGLGSNFAFAQEFTVYYDLVGIPAQPIEPPRVAATTTGPGVRGLDLSLGPGVSMGSLANGFAAIGWNRDNPSLENSIATGAYFEFGLEFDEAGHTASLSTVDLWFRRSSIYAPGDFQLQASLDGFKTPGFVVADFTYLGRVTGSAPFPNPLDSDPFYYMTYHLTGRPDGAMVVGDSIPTIDLRKFPQLQNLPAGTKVTFRLYAWGNADTAANLSLALGRVKGPLIAGVVKPAN